MPDYIEVVKILGRQQLPLKLGPGHNVNSTEYGEVRATGATQCLLIPPSKRYIVAFRA